METLANKYRPQTFEDVVGQNITTTILKNMLDSGTITHSMLFVGPAGCGKTTCARIVASQIDGEIIEVDSASHNGVTEIKEIIEKSRTHSLIHKYKVFILDEAHTITPAAWSSLLIPLEEKLSTSIFIFCTTDPKKIPDTILSRVLLFNFLRLSEETIFNRLIEICQKENIEYDTESLSIITSKSSGNLRDALSKLDKCLMYGKLSKETTEEILNTVSRENIKKFFESMKEDKKHSACIFIRSLDSRGFDLYQFLQDSLTYLLNESLSTNNNYLNDIEWVLDVLKELKYMITQPYNVRDFICARILVR